MNNQRPNLASVGMRRRVAFSRPEMVRVPFDLQVANPPPQPTGNPFQPDLWPRCAVGAPSIGRCVECIYNHGGDELTARRYCSQLYHPIPDPRGCQGAPTYRECLDCASNSGLDPYQAQRLCVPR